MLSQTFFYWDKQQSADSIIIQFHLTLKCTKRSTFQLLRLFLSFEMNVQYHDRGLNKFHSGSEQPLVCLVINNFSHPTVKNGNTAMIHLGNIECWLEGFSNNV